jgi:hypothetical protein
MLNRILIGTRSDSLGVRGTRVARSTREKFTRDARLVAEYLLQRTAIKPKSKAGAICNRTSSS